MIVDRVSHIEPLQPGKKPGRAESVRGGDQKDTITISPESIAKAERLQVIEQIRATPELSDKRIEELRAKINDPAYINEQVLKATADNIMTALGVV